MLTLMDLATEKKVWSRNFWLRKLLRVAAFILLGVLLTQLWNWESQQDEPTAINSSGSEQTEAQQVSEPEPEPVFPYEISLPDSATGPVEVTTEAGSLGYQYTFADAATMVVYPDGLEQNATDVTWTHQVGADGDVLITNQPTTLCALGTANCTAGNGTIDITSRPAEGRGSVVVVITDTNIATKTFEQAQAQYEAIINTIKVVN